MDEQPQFNPKRRLCPDGACIGIIGPDGRCVECGRVAAGPPDVSTNGASATAGDTVPLPAPTDEDPPADGAFAAALSSAAAAPAPGDQGRAADDFDPRRQLCDDGTCVGVVGPTGTCTVCGRAAAVH